MWSRPSYTAASERNEFTSEAALLSPVGRDTGNVEQNTEYVEGGYAAHQLRGSPLCRSRLLEMTDTGVAREQWKR